MNVAHELATLLTIFVVFSAKIMTMAYYTVAVGTHLTISAMQTSSRYTTVAHPVSSKGSGWVTLVRDGRELPTPLEGDDLEGQFELDHDHTLVCLSDGSAYEAGLHIYLLDARDVVVDSILGASPYASGIFKTIECGDSWVNFEFFTNDVVYRMSVLEDPRFRFNLPTGWKYKHRLQTHRLMLTSQP